MPSLYLCIFSNLLVVDCNVVLVGQEVDAGDHSGRYAHQQNRRRLEESPAEEAKGEAPAYLNRLQSLHELRIIATRESFAESKGNVVIKSGSLN